MAENTATDTDVLTPTADLAITKDDGVDSVIPGESMVTAPTTMSTRLNRENALSA